MTIPCKELTVTPPVTPPITPPVVPPVVPPVTPPVTPPVIPPVVPPVTPPVTPPVIPPVVPPVTPPVTPPIEPPVQIQIIPFPNRVEGDEFWIKSALPLLDMLPGVPYIGGIPILLGFKLSETMWSS